LGGRVSGVSAVMARYVNHEMEEFDIPSIREFIEMTADTGAGVFGNASVDLFGLEKDDSLRHQDIITVGEFYAKAAGSQVILT
jgi:peroxiredoxin family protein